MYSQRCINFKSSSIKALYCWYYTARNHADLGLPPAVITCGITVSDRRVSIILEEKRQ
jgi:hypothetical protein